jgi:hypothetical protein
MMRINGSAILTPGLEVLSLDDRIRTAAKKLGFSLQPA